jgi:hypothetical protein
MRLLVDAQIQHGLCYCIKLYNNCSYCILVLPAAPIRHTPPSSTLCSDISNISDISWPLPTPAQTTPTPTHPPTPHPLPAYCLLAVTGNLLVRRRGDVHFFNAPHINNRPLKSSLPYAKLKLNRRVGRWRKPVFIARWPVARFAKSRLLHVSNVRTTTSFA